MAMMRTARSMAQMAAISARVELPAITMLFQPLTGSDSKRAAYSPRTARTKSSESESRDSASRDFSMKPFGVSMYW
jgi:hypothetical protein